MCVWLNRSVWAPTNLLKQPECHMLMVASICLIDELNYIYVLTDALDDGIERMIVKQHM